MPLLTISTNTHLTPEATRSFIDKASTTVADLLGKPEKYVMVMLQPSVSMSFAGSDSPTAFLQLKSIGLPESSVPGFSDALCGLTSQALGINTDRIYIEFSNAERQLWGWNGTTF